MRLRRIEAVRYGALAGQALGDLGDGLTVVHGPNEAGKSTYTALVRHVLYRYPTARDAEAGYAVGGEGRSARLVFDDAEGTWVVERTEGPHGGRVAVRTLGGVDRPALLDELTRGVSELAYRTVFGFGLSEMAAIEEQRSSGDSIIARLYAASAGLRVSPQEVRAAIDREAAALYKPTARKPEVNALLAEVRKTRAELRALQAQADLFMADQERLKELELDLETAREVREQARERSTELAVAVERADERLSAIAAEETSLLRLRRERSQLADEHAAIVVTDALVEAAPALDALLEEAAGQGRALQALRDGEGAVLRAETRVADALARTGLSPEALAALGDAHESIAVVEEAREDLQRLHLQCEARDADERRAADVLRAAESALAAQMGTLDAGEAGPSEAIAERLAALDALESLRAGQASPTRHGPPTPALIMAASGVVAVIAGVLLREWSTVGIGAVLVVVGGVLAARSALRPRAGLPVDERPYLRLLGLAPEASALEVSRVRRALEAARSAATVRETATREVENAARDAQISRDVLTARTAQWAGWLTTHGLDETCTPSAVSAVLGLVRETQVADAAASEARGAHEYARAQLEAFTDRFASAAAPFVDVPATCTAPDVPALANRLKERLAAVRSALARREELSRALSAADARLAEDDARMTRARTELLEVLSRFDLAEGGNHEGLRILHANAKREESEATARHEELARARHELAGRLENGARERRGGELHLREAGLAERLAESVDRYLVLSTASALLAEAQGRHQRERQPAVVKSAERLFTTMTGGRYIGLSVPLSEGRIEVHGTHAETRTSDMLSRGTAEQLYLAIRLGLISQLGAVGAGLPVLMDDVLVNFDPARRRGAAEAIVELAATHQVVFFTCHPETADLFDEVAPGHVRLDIDRQHA